MIYKCKNWETCHHTFMVEEGDQFTVFCDACTKKFEEEKREQDRKREEYEHTSQHQFLDK